MPKRKVASGGKQVQPAKTRRGKPAADVSAATSDDVGGSSNMPEKVGGGNTLEDVMYTPPMTPSVKDTLGVNISAANRTKVQNAEYVDLSIFLENPQDPDRAEKKLSIVDGELIVPPKSGKSKILEINKWTDAILIYASIYLEAHPIETQEILKYISSVRLGASRTSGLGWKQYDEQFRLQKAKHPDRSWGEVNGELWLLYMYNDSQSVLGGRNVPMGVPGRLQGKCYDFNYKGSCFKNPCNFRHMCLKCDGAHSSSVCHNRAQSFQASVPNKGGNFRPQAPRNATVQGGPRFPPPNPPRYMASRAFSN